MESAFEFISLASGSSGNCYYLGNGKQGVLIDAGISTRRIVQGLKKEGIELKSLMGILVTHNHNDHIRALDLLTSKHHLPVYTTATVWKEILGNPYHKKLARDCVRNIDANHVFNLAGWNIEAFTISHDTPETLGFYLWKDRNKITVVTDLGYICDTAAHYIRQANFLVIESNYDEQMLENGPYPVFLKDRIRGMRGHLSNQSTADFLANNYHPELSHILLAHLSQQNNHPDLALNTLQTALSQNELAAETNPYVATLSRSRVSERIQLP